MKREISSLLYPELSKWLFLTNFLMKLSPLTTSARIIPEKFWTNYRMNSHRLKSFTAIPIMDRGTPKEPDLPLPAANGLSPWIPTYLTDRRKFRILSPPQTKATTWLSAAASSPED